MSRTILQLISPAFKYEKSVFINMFVHGPLIFHNSEVPMNYSGIEETGEERWPFMNNP